MPHHDYPSLRDLETSNLFSGVNHNFNIQRHLDQRRLQKLEDLKKVFEANKKVGFITFDDLIDPPAQP